MRGASSLSQQGRGNIKRPVATNRNIKKASSPQSPSIVHKPIFFRQTKFVEDPEMTELKNSLLNKTPICKVEHEMLQKFSAYIREYTQYCGKKGNYDEAEQCAKLSEKVASELARRRKVPATTRNINPNVENNQKRVEFESYWNNEETKFEEETSAKIQELKKRQEDERKDFEELWSSEMPRKYRKPSARLLQIKQIEKSLVASGEYARAKSIHKEAVTLAAKEAELAQKSLIENYDIAKRKLNQKFAIEVEQLLASRNHQKILLESRREAEAEAVAKRDQIIARKSKDGFSRTKMMEVRVAESPINVEPQFVVGSDLDGDDILLPVLKAPNDPSIQARERKRKSELSRKKSEFQRANAEAAVSLFAITVPRKTKNQSLKQEKIGVEVPDVVIKGSLTSDELVVEYRD